MHRFRQNLKKQLTRLEDDQDILILSGLRNKDFVVLTLEAFNAMEETAHLLSTQANASRLLERIEQDRTGNVTARELDLDDEKPAKSKEKNSLKHLEA
ncbi:MAG: type II toxin-antitoxin system Phd/YefM family antitoxin [Bacteroidota bacterium]